MTRDTTVFLTTLSCLACASIVTAIWGNNDDFEAKYPCLSKDNHLARIENGYVDLAGFPDLPHKVAEKMCESNFAAGLQQNSIAQRTTD